MFMVGSDTTTIRVRDLGSLEPSFETAVFIDFYLACIHRFVSVNKVNIVETRN